MTILLRWLIDHVWVFYIGCAIGALIYLVRALAAQREQSLAMFTLEHEAATARAVRAWAMVFFFIVVSLVIFIGTRLVLASYPAYDPAMPVPTSTPSSGVNPPTPSPSTTVTDTITLPTLPAATATPPEATAPSDPTAAPTPAPTESPAPTPSTTPAVAGPLSGSLDVRFGDFGMLVGWQLSATEIGVGEPLVLTLVWQGLEGDTSTNYTVFTHLLSQNGELIAQHDGPPAGGAQNTSSWSAGQVIEDTHQLSFRSGVEDPTGPARVIVGLYDPADIGNRLTTSLGQDYVELPVTINVVPQ
jgi:hypothetical protein